MALRKLRSAPSEPKANKAGTVRASSDSDLNECRGEFAGFRANAVIFSHFSKALIFLLLFPSREKEES
jgi:hypothetical protein